MLFLLMSQNGSMKHASPCVWNGGLAHRPVLPQSKVGSATPVCLLQLLYPAVFLGFYYAMTVFEVPFGLYYAILLMVAWWAYGVGYVFSVMLDSNNALLAGLCVTLVFGGVINGASPSVASAQGNVLLNAMQHMSYSRCVSMCGLYYGQHLARPASTLECYMSADCAYAVDAQLLDYIGSIAGLIHCRQTHSSTPA